MVTHAERIELQEKKQVLCASLRHVNGQGSRFVWIKPFFARL